MLHKTSKIALMALISLSFSANIFADTFVQVAPKKKPMPISPLTPFDKALQKEIAKYPKDTAFYIDGRTGKIISATKPPKIKSQPPKIHPKPNTPAPKSPKAPKPIPYEMQEERIELLQ
ncbi:hypothetical protein [Helicobacter valdiviensis]|nr:hypothetical protein [Helicobacter valdiviensis]